MLVREFVDGMDVPGHYEGIAVAMSHVLAATRIEFEKLDRPLAPQETRGWV